MSQAITSVNSFQQSDKHHDFIPTKYQKNYMYYPTQNPMNTITLSTIK